MAHTKSGGSTRLGRDSESKRLGIKVNNNEAIKSGEIIVRQRGTHYVPGKNVSRGGDDTIYAATAGTVQFVSSKKNRFDRSVRYVTVVNVEPKD